MAMKRIPIEQATPRQMREYCRVVLGLDGISDSTNTGQLAAKIEGVQPGCTHIVCTDEAAPKVVEAVAGVPELDIEVPDAPDIAAMEKEYRQDPEKDENGKSVIFARRSLPALAGSGHHNDPKVVIKIPSTSEPGGDRDVPVAVNGDLFLLKREIETPVPYRVYEALKHAVQKKFERKNTSNNPLDPGDVIERDAYSYPFQVISMPHEREVLAWRRRTQGAFNP